jgi:hypothetical protein
MRATTMMITCLSVHAVMQFMRCCSDILSTVNKEKKDGSAHQSYRLSCCIRTHLVAGIIASIACTCSADSAYIVYYFADHYCPIIF